MSNSLRVIVLALLLLSVPAAAQRRLSADVEVKTVAGRSVVTTTKSVYCANNGRLVVCNYKPVEYTMVTNINGETKIYFKKTKEVLVDNQGMMSSKDELLALFLLGRIEDLGVGLFGYRLQKTEYVDDGLMKKTFKCMDPNMPPYTEIVYGKDYLPIYSATLTEDGHVQTKVYYTQYKTVGYVPFPHRLTQISYNSPTDSTVVRTVYSNVVADSDDTMFDFQVPADAVPMDLSGNTQKLR
ncbi:MAG: hypothetical protein J5667_04935 [Bacteroidales bacterium]|nr:hypothetical protein [Bacteroidales bacterium]